MRIGVPAEIKNNEFRVAITPSGVHALTRRGHEVTVQAGAGAGSGIDDGEYAAAGAAIGDDVEALWADSEMVLKVKEPIAEEYSFLRPDLSRRRGRPGRRRRDQTSAVSEPRAALRRSLRGFGRP